jgi:hypothetical protein
MPARTFHYAGLSVRAEAADAGALDWLGEFLAPAYTPAVDHGAVAAWTVRLEIDPPRYAHCTGQSRRGEAVAFLLDSGPARLPLHDAGGPGLLADDAELGVCYRVEAAGAGARVLVLAGNGRARVRSALMRPLRELGMDAARQRGGLLLHAAACALHGRAVLIVGPKEAGKTSLLTYLLGAGRRAGDGAGDGAGAALLGNDRLLIEATGAGARARGVPTVVSIRRGTLALFPALWQQVRQARFRLHATLAECADAAAPPARLWPDGRLGLTAAQYCAACGCGAAASAPAALLLFPRRTGVPGGLRLQRLSRAEGVRRIGACRLGATVAEAAAGPADRPDKGVGDGLGDRPDAGIRSALFQALDPGAPAPAPTAAVQALSALSAYDCALGNDAFADTGAAESLLRLLEGEANA